MNINFNESHSLVKLDLQPLKLFRNLHRENFTDLTCLQLSIVQNFLKLVDIPGKLCPFEIDVSHLLAFRKLVSTGHKCTEFPYEEPTLPIAIGNKLKSKRHGVSLKENKYKPPIFS